ncbi:hypothetical protein [Demequina sp. NBRC 110053]|uniref:hypothetical protein n=1 Tax=Demequina sp. NBRC 110053 TaxID=1570342 RepID=UPI000A02B6EE|nr:hypothetical protein [Demequina sp. NBRC 110053]
MSRGHDGVPGARARHALAAPVLAGALAVACAALALPSAATTDAPDEAADPGADPMTVEVPYLAETQVSINPAWTLTACPAAPDGAPVSVACDESGEGIVVTATSYDRDAGPWPFPVEVERNGAEPATLEYTLALAPPEPPTPVAGRLPVPGVAGGRTLIPLASLVEECTYCGDGVAVTAVAVEPEDGPMRVRAWVAERHLVIDTDEGATEAVIEVTVEDSAGGASQASEVTVSLTGPPSSPAVGLHVVMPATSSVELTPADLVLNGGDDAWSIVECVGPARGTLSCAPEGIGYERDATDHLDDQLAVVLMAPDGRTATASVTVSSSAVRQHLAGAARTEGGLAPVATRSPASTATVDAGADTGILTALWSRIPRLT